MNRRRALVEEAMPCATPAEKARRVDEATQGAGVELVRDLGASKVVRPDNLSEADAEAALDSMTARSVTAEDVRERGAEALTSPRAKGKASDPVPSVVRAFLKLGPDDRRRAFADISRHMAEGVG